MIHKDKYLYDEKKRYNILLEILEGKEEGKSRNKEERFQTSIL
jgi:hypothetical protein